MSLEINHPVPKDTPKEKHQVAELITELNVIHGELQSSTVTYCKKRLRSVIERLDAVFPEAKT